MCATAKLSNILVHMAGRNILVPLSTLHPRKEHGGWGLIDIAAKSRALLLGRLRTEDQKEETITAAWL